MYQMVPRCCPYVAPKWFLVVSIFVTIWPRDVLIKCLGFDLGSVVRTYLYIYAYMIYHVVIEDRCDVKIGAGGSVVGRGWL